MKISIVVPTFREELNIKDKLHLERNEDIYANLLVDVIYRINRKIEEKIIQSDDYIRVIYENDDFVCLHRFSRGIDDEVVFSMMTAINYKNGKVITQKTIREP